VTGSLIMWNDVTTGFDGEYERWHANEHVPQRMEVAGFRRARRYSNLAAPRQRYCVVYDVDSLATLGSSAYRAVLDRTDESAERVMSQFRDFTRGACEVAYGRRRYTGGAVRTWRFQAERGRRAALLDEILPVASALGQLPDVTAVQLLACDRWAPATRSREREIRERNAPDGTFDAALLAETRSPAQADRLAPSWAGLRPEFAETYRLDLLFETGG
jgi:hypothetical protein